MNDAGSRRAPSAVLAQLLPAVAFAVAAGAVALRNAEIQPWTLDDAYISFRYAEQWAAGHGPVFNVGERVEGYTCFLWVALLAMGHGLGASTEPLAKGLGAIAAGATLALTAIAGRWVAGFDPRAGPAAALLLGCSGAFAAWALSGMEVSLVALLVTAAWLAHWRGDPRLTGVLGALATLSRPDAALVPLVQGVELAWRRRWRDLVVHTGVAAAVVGPWWLARWAWYGWFLPNTFYAKVGSTSAQVARGLDYVAGAIGPTAPLWLPALLLVLAPSRSRWAGAAGWIGLHLLYVVAVGGDVMPAYRFLVVVLGPLALLAGIGLAAAADRLGSAFWLAVPVLCAASLLLPRWDPELSARLHHDDVSRNGREVGLWLRENLPPDTLIATNTAGSVPYFSGFRAVDMLGLCDERIAHTPAPRMGHRAAGHEKANGRYVLSRNPDVVLFGAARGRRAPFFRSDHQLHALPGFRERYRLEGYRLPLGLSVWIWRRRDSPAPRQPPIDAAEKKHTPGP